MSPPEAIVVDPVVVVDPAIDEVEGEAFEEPAEESAVEAEVHDPLPAQADLAEQAAIAKASEPAQAPEPMAIPTPAKPVAIATGPAEKGTEQAQLKPANDPVSAPAKPVKQSIPSAPPAPEHKSESPPIPDEQAVAKATAAPQAAKPASAAQARTMDLDSLTDRLRKTKAFGVFTKLELKSQVNDLLDDMEKYHESKNRLSLNELEEHFNLLVMKLMVLLEEDDPQLQKEIARARPTLWSTLADPVQFSSIKGP